MSRVLLFFDDAMIRRNVCRSGVFGSGLRLFPTKPEEEEEFLMFDYCD